MIRMFHTFAAETGALTQAVKDDIVECCRTVVALEDNFIDLAFSMGPVQGMTADDIKKYIRYIADWRLGQLKLQPIYGRTRELLRAARDGILQRGDWRRVARLGRRVGHLRQGPEARRGGVGRQPPSSVLSRTSVARR
jgi:hypothetical protein